MKNRKFYIIALFSVIIILLLLVLYPKTKLMLDVKNRTTHEIIDYRN